MNSIVDQKAKFKVNTLTSSKPMKFVAHDIRGVIKSIHSIYESGSGIEHWLQTMND